MPIRTWLYVIALGVAFSATSVWPQVAIEDEPVGETGQENSGDNGDAATQEDETGTPDIIPALQGVESAIRDLISEEDKIEADRQRDNESRDLKAQEGMATWAKWMFWATLGTAIVTFVGIVLIGFTLHFTRKASFHTEKMLEEAKISSKAAMKAADSALEANITSRKFGELQVRAYLSASNFRAKDINESIFIIEFDLSNNGGSTAFNIEGIIAAFSDESVSPESKVPNVDVLGHFPIAASLPPRTTERRYIPVSRQKSISSSFKETAENDIVVVEVVVKYQTVFDREDGRLSGELSFRAEIDQDDLISGETIDVKTEQAFRSGWIGDFLKRREDGEFGVELWPQYPDKD